MNQPTLIMEGFICPECQQDLTNAELLQAHFELVHSKGNKNGPSYKRLAASNSKNNLQNGDSGFSSVIAKAKNIIISFEQGNDMNESDLASMSSLNLITNACARPLINPIGSNLNSSQNARQIQSNSAASNVSYLFMKQYFNSNQHEGYFKSHTSEFKKLRDSTIGRYVVQSNKLLITLDKLITIDLSVFSDENKRDTHYKSIVAWLEDKDVHLCPNCAKGFNMLNRKHHCRLCGAIMCNKCSKFISFTLAKQITDPDLFDRSSNKGKLKLKRSDSITSVNSYFFKTSSNVEKSNEKRKSNMSGVITDQIYLRICFDCGRALEKKYNLIKDKITRSLFDNLYDDLHFTITESQRLYPAFKKMSESLFCGEAIYQLSNAEEMRTKLIKLYQQVDIMSSAILKYGINQEVGAATDSNNNGPSSTAITNDQFKLQRNIRFYAVNYLKDYSFNLPQLPSSQEYEKVKSQLQRYLNEEKKRNELEQMKQRKQIDDQVVRNQSKSGQNSKHVRQSSQNVTIDNVNGWIPSKPNISLVEDLNSGENLSVALNNEKNNSYTDEKLNEMSIEKNNALRIQIKLVEGYLNDALKHNKLEEARILEKNLNDLMDNLEMK